MTRFSRPREIVLSFYDENDSEYRGYVEVTDDDISDYLEENGVYIDEDFSYDEWMENTRYDADSFSEFCRFLKDRYKETIISNALEREEEEKWDRRLP